MRTTTLAAIAFVAVLLPFGAGVGAGAAQAQTVIGPGQHFIGLVNGSNDTPTVFTVCPGPSSSPQRKGPVASGQALEVAQVVGGTGNTGVFSSIEAWVVPATTGNRPPHVTFTHYGRSKAIPTSWRVPCNGNGTV